MQIFYGIVVLLSCIICTLPPGHVAQPGIQQGCPLLRRCNRTDIDVCATNGQSCKRFPSDCELQGENCNRTLATAWQRTNRTQCTNIRSNATGLCACSAGALNQLCSNQTVTTGICAHGVLGHRVHSCRRFRTECDLRRARCAGAEWHTIDNRQCRGFRLNQSNPCICPKLLQCSRNRTQRCVQVSESACRLYGSECDVENHRCDGEILRNVPRILCTSLRINVTGRCHCPALLTCSANKTNICVQTTTGCELKRDECELEQSRCQNQTLNITTPIQCLGFQPGERKACACPKLTTCSRNITNICVRTGLGCLLLRNECELEVEICAGKNLTLVDIAHCRGFTDNRLRNCTCPKLDSCERNSSSICAVTTSNQCRLLRNQCDLERARCEGLQLNITTPLQCLGFQGGESKPCTCPKLATCSRNNTNICVRTGHSCVLLRNECELEQEICAGKNITDVDGIHCKGFTHNRLRNCSCPKLASCNRNSSNICVTTTTNQCRLLRNQCDLERARCEGQKLNITTPLQCLGFQTDESKTCTCPKLTTCSRNNTNICVQTGQNCTLQRNECEMEQEICAGKNITQVDSIQCKGFIHNQLRNCSCPKLKSCDRNSTNICVMSGTNQCRLLRSQCDLERAKCEGLILSITNPVQCLNFTTNATRNCSCPLLLSCKSNGTSICVRNNNKQCLLLRNRCELEQAKCERKGFQPTHSIQCMNFQVNQQKPCECPKLLTCSRKAENICIRTKRGCKRLRTQCELEEAKCRRDVMATVKSIHCQSFKPHEEKSCFCPKLKTCNRKETQICTRSGAKCSLLRNECELEQMKCQNHTTSVVKNLHCNHFKIGDTKLCTCTRLFNCSTRATPICAKLKNGCKMLSNKCELETEKCLGNEPKILSALHCLDFKFGQLKNCSCPQLKTCSRAENNICVRISENRCQVLKNECELEELKCQGEKVTVLPNMHCKSMTVGQKGSCYCLGLLDCGKNSSQVCVESARGCTLLQSQCDLEERKCQGEDIKSINMLHCQQLRVGQLKACACPRLKSCTRNKRANICVRNRKGCMLMKDVCELEEARCKGESWITQDIAQCRNFSVYYIGRCTCPRLNTCARWDNRNTCLQRGRLCKHARNQCEVERSRCMGAGFTVTPPQRCQGIRRGATALCKCPELRQCNRRRPICAQNVQQCKRFRNDCEFKRALCQGEKWRAVAIETCCQLRPNETRNCSLSATTAICGRLPNQMCRLFTTLCEFNAVNAKLRRKYSLVDRNQCKCVGARRTGRCTPKPTCTIPRGNDRKVCGRFRNSLKWFNSQCQLSQHNFETCRSFQAVGSRSCRNIRN